MLGALGPKCCSSRPSATAGALPIIVPVEQHGEGARIWAGPVAGSRQAVVFAKTRETARPTATSICAHTLALPKLPQQPGSVGLVVKTDPPGSDRLFDAMSFGATTRKSPEACGATTTRRRPCRASMSCCRRPTALPPRNLDASRRSSSGEGGRPPPRGCSEPNPRIASRRRADAVCRYPHIREVLD